MEYIRVTKENLEKEHICCAISNNKDIQVSSKKAWLADRFDEGLVFLKSVERGKCFIEYIPRSVHGIQSKHLVICILIVCGCPDLSKVMDIQVTYFPSVLRTAKKRGRKAYVFLRQQGKAISGRSEVSKI